jgi:hypothetical protein
MYEYVLTVLNNYLNLSNTTTYITNMKTPFPKIIRVRRRKGMIDLTDSWREDHFIPAVVNKEERLREKYQEAHITTPLEELFVPPPTLTQEEKTTMWERIKIITFIKSLRP